MAQVNNAYQNIPQTYPAINNQYATPGFQNGALWAANNPFNTPTVPVQQPIQSHQINTTPTPQQVNSSRIWVQGEGAAKAFIVANNSEQELWDAEQPVIYIKTVDNTGKPSLLTLDYTIRNPKKEDQNETDALKNEIAELKDMMKQLMSQRNNYNQNYKKKGADD